MALLIAALVALMLAGASPLQGGGIDPDGAAAAHASAVSTDAGVRIDPEG